MRARERRYAAFLTAATLFTTATLASATDVPYECNTNGTPANWSVVVDGPFSITCPTLAGGECTELEYVVTPLRGRLPDHTAILVDHELDLITFDSQTAYPPCDGDNLTNLGIRDCSNQAVRLNKEADKAYLRVIAEGEAVAVGRSIVVKKGSVVEECRIASLAPPPVPYCDPKAQQNAKETFQFEDCIIEIPLDPCTGEPGEPSVISGDCATDSAPIGTLQLVLNGGVTQNVTIGDGWISSGENSCTTRMFNGTSYTTCTCADASDCAVKKKDGSPLCGSPCPR
jgi:hypothetical protein